MSKKTDPDNPNSKKLDLGARPARRRATMSSGQLQNSLSAMMNKLEINKQPMDTKLEIVRKQPPRVVSGAMELTNVVIPEITNPK